MSRLYEGFLRKAPRQSRSRGVVEAILDAAVILANRGLDEVSLAATARKAGVGIGSLYDYFTDRESLLAALAAKLTEDNVAAFAAVLKATETMPIEAMAEVLVDHALASYAMQPQLTRAALLGAHRSGLVPVLAKNQAAFAEALGRHLRTREDLARGVDVEAFSFVVVSAVMGLVQAFVWLDDPPELTRIRRETIRMIVDASRRPNDETPSR